MQFKLRETSSYYFFLFFLLVIVISLAGLYYYNYMQDKEKQEAYNNLETFAKQKVNEVVNWRNERISDAKFIYEIAPLKKLVHSFLENPNSDKLKKEIVQWLKPLKENHEYVNINAVNNSGSVYSLFKSADSLSNYDKVLWQQSIRSKEIVLAGFYKNPHTNEITLSNFVPLFYPEIDNGNVFGVMELRIDPKKILYPLVNVAPIKSKTAETFLVSPDGDSITFLNELRFKKNSALSFKLPISLKNLPAAMAIKGKRGIYEGVDYKNAKVLAHLDQIPGSQWFIVSKIDLDEIYAPIRESAAYILAGVIILILLGGSIVFIAWKNAKIKSFSRQFYLEKERKDLFRNMDEGYAYCQIILEDDRPIDFIYLEVNNAFSELFGVQSAAGKKITEINPQIKETNPELLEIYGRVALTGIPERFETYRINLNKWFMVSVYSPEKGYFVSIFNDITDQKKSFLELKKLSRAVEQSPASVVITDLNGLIEYVNPKFTEVTGYTFEEAIGKNPRILNSGKTPKFVFKKLWKTITAGKEWRGELYNKKKNGELFWENVTISPIKNEEGFNTHYIAVKEDITKRKQIEKELEASEERFSKAFSSNPNALIISRIKDGTIVEINATFLKLFGYARSEVIGNNSIALTMFANPDDREKAIQLLKQNGSLKDFELKIKTKIGDEHFALLSSEILEVAGEQSILSIIQDISERKKAERELHELARQRQLALDSANLGWWHYDPATKISWWDEKYKEIFGVSGYQSPNDKILERIHIEDLPGVWAKVEAALNPIDPKQYFAEYRILLDDGSIRWIEAYGAADFEGTGTGRHAVSFIGTVQDITNRKKTETELAVKATEIEAAFSNIADAIIVFDNSGKIIRYNKAAEQIFGHFQDGSELIPVEKSSKKIKAWTEDNRELTLDEMPHYRAAVHAETVKGLVLKIQGQADLFWVILSAVPLFVHGKHIGCIVSMSDITQLKKAEGALRESEEQLKRAQEISHLGSWQLDLTNNKLTWSDEVYKIFGLKPQEFKATYEAFLESVYPEDRQAVNEAYSGSIRDGKDTYEIEHRVIRRATGEIRFVREKCEHLKDRSGKIFLSIGMVHDITEQKRTENELNESLSLHQTISSTVPFGMQIVDKTGMILFANESIIKLAAENIKGQKCWEIYKDDRKQCNDCPLSNPRPVGTTTMIEAEGVLGGRTFEIYHTEMIYKGKPALLEIFQDITSRKKAEEALRLSEQSFRHLADSMPQLVWTADPNGTVDYYNRQVAEFEGITKNEDGNWAWSPVLHEDDIRPTVDAWNNSVETGSNYEIIHRVKKKNGKLRWFLSRAYPVKDSNGKIIKWYGTSTDINEQKKAEQDLEYALLELKRSNKELEQFAYTASHDLQEPIRMVKSYAQILSMNNKEILNSTDIENLDFIVEGATRMQELANDLLKYSRVTTTKKTFEPVDCNIILKDVLNDLKLRIKEENALIEIGELPVIMGDKTQLRQVFQNLIQNAVKFRGKNNPEIKIGSVKKNGQWIFSIKDNGIGIDPKFHDKIFVIFHRLHNREKYPGTGIGLSICKKIVELHGGQMYVDSELNKGTTFYFTIPV